MKDKFTSIIISFIIILIFAVIILFGIIIFKEFKEIDVSSEIEDFIPDLSSIEENILNENIKVPDVVNNPLNDIQQSPESKNIDYNNITVNKYFYNQLDEYSKVIYRAFESNKENMKSGTYKIQFGTSFGKILSGSNGQDVLGKYYQSAIEAYNYDNPDTFYLNPSKMYLNIETITKGSSVTYNVYMDSGDKSNYLIDEFNSKEQVDTAIKNIEQISNNIISNKTGNIYQDIKMVHDYLVDNIQYDETISKQNIYNIYGALINNKCVCEGYAKSFKYLLDGFGIPTTLVIGKATNSEGGSENHAWNYVQINDKWYAVDVTWDDPIISGGGRIDNSRKYKYFLKGSNEFNQNHFSIGQFTQNGKTFNYPELSSNNYN